MDCHSSKSSAAKPNSNILPPPLMLSELLDTELFKLLTINQHVTGPSQGRHRSGLLPEEPVDCITPSTQKPVKGEGGGRRSRSSTRETVTLKTQSELTDAFRRQLLSLHAPQFFV